MSKFSFSTPTPAPATGGLFGQQQPAAPAFGAAPGASQGFSFGQMPATTAAPSFGGFGAAAAPAATQPQGFGGFSTPATQAAAQPQGFGGFGATAPVAAAQPQGFGGFGSLTTPAPAQPQGFGGFGAAAAPAATQPQGFGFGQSALPTATTQPQQGFSGFGGLNTTPASSAAPVLNFGATTNTLAATPQFSGFGLGGTQAPAASIGFGLSGQTTTTAAPSLFGAPKSSAATQPFTSFSTAASSGGLFGATATTGPTLSLTTAPTVIGLGGVDLNASQPKAVEGGNAQKDGGKVKESKMPKEIMETVNSLKDHIKQQKTLSSEISRTSTSKLFDVSNKIDTLNWSLTEMTNFVETNYTAIKQLRVETSRAIQHAEMAQRTHETPAGLQFENQAPLQYFHNLVQQYEHDLIQFRKQVELTEKHMYSIANPQSLTPDDLKRGLQQIHESFVALAGRLHDTHQKVESQKEQYLNLRKYLLRDKTNVFEQLEHESSADMSNANQSKVSSGPTPFSTVLQGMNRGLSMNSAVAAGQQQQQQQQQQHGGQQTSSFGMAVPSTGFGGGSLFGGGGNTAFGGASSNFSAGGADTFNLQKPPIGSKRNKQ